MFDKKEYAALYRQRRKREPQGWISTTYRNMRSRNRAKFGKELSFTRTEFESWLFQNYAEKFGVLFEAYAQSDCDKYLAPSIDRIDDYKSYELANLQLLTWAENDLKGTLSEKNKRQCGEMAKRVFSKPVAQYTLDGKLLNTFPSTREAGRVLGVNPSTVSTVCRGELRTHKGFVWKYISESEELIND